tara:strand:- start:56933 stop:59527 length:2595 start_codon:yes stop_codon:yes gene_type:complete
MPKSGIESRPFDKTVASISGRIQRLFENGRVSFLSALSEPDNYAEDWEKWIKALRETYDDIDDVGRALKTSIDEKTLFSQEAEDVSTDSARRVFEGVKTLRYSQDNVPDPFIKEFNEGVYEKLLNSNHYFAMFLHWAMRSHNDPISANSWKKHGDVVDDFTTGYDGLDLKRDEIQQFIISHYTEGETDTSRLESKYKGAMKLLEKVYMEENDERSWDKLQDLSLIKAEKAAPAGFLIPNKPMYRIFDVEDIDELKGFTGDWVVQEKYDGMRVQLHKLGEQITIYSHNEKEITDKFPKQVALLKAKHFGDCILDGEAVLFRGEESLHRADTVAHIFKDKQGEDLVLRVHVFDIMRHEDRDMTDVPLDERLSILASNYTTHSDEMLAFPSKKDTRSADSLKEIKEYAEEIMQIPTAEGVVIKDSTSTYFVGQQKNPKWIKWKKSVDLDLIVLVDKKTKSGLHSYTLGAGPITAEQAEAYGKKAVEMEDRHYLNVGKALNTKICCKEGSIVRVTVDEVKEGVDDTYTLYSAKVVELPEVTMPDKLVTLALLSKSTKKSLSSFTFGESAVKKSLTITDNIHGTAELIIKSDSLEGFVLYGFTDDGLMAKNALANYADWKEQLGEVLKTNTSEIRMSIYNYLKDNPTKNSLSSIEAYLVKEQPKLYSNALQRDIDELNQFLDAHSEEGSDKVYLYDETKQTYSANPEVILQDSEENNMDITKEYKVPKEKREGEFQIHKLSDGKSSFIMNIDGKEMGWTLGTEDMEDIFNLFGKTDKFVAQIEEKPSKGKIIDKGVLGLGVQRDGYHEYFLNGEKFDTKLHFRVVPIKEEDRWVGFTSVKQTKVDSSTDEGVWDVNDDSNKKLLLIEQS